MNDDRDTCAPTPEDSGAIPALSDRDMANRLPGLIETAFRRYRDFTSIEPPDKPKDFATYNTACRAALGHLEQLLKLARWSDANSPLVAQDSDVDSLIAKAKAALEKAAADT